MSFATCRCKELKKLTAKQLKGYLEKNTVINLSQYGLRSGYSKGDA